MTDWNRALEIVRKQFAVYSEMDPLDHPSFPANRAMEYACKELGVAADIEGFVFDAGDGNSGGLQYINVGDPYLTTICFNSDSVEFWVGCYGDFIEERQNQGLPCGEG